MREFKTNHRISEIMKALNMTADEVRKVYYAFDKLLVLKKHLPDSYISKNWLSYRIDCQGERKYITQCCGSMNLCDPKDFRRIFSEM